MLCKADFEHLCPESFAPSQNERREPKISEPNITCISRWEDDGGRTLEPRKRRHRSW